MWLRRHATAGLHAAFSAAVKAWVDRQDECTIGGISTPALSQAGQSSHGSVVTPTRGTEHQGNARRRPGAEVNLPFPLPAPCVSSGVPVSVPQAPLLAGEATAVGDVASAIAELRAELAARPVLPASGRPRGGAVVVSRAVLRQRLDDRRRAVQGDAVRAARVEGQKRFSGTSFSSA